MQNSCRNVYQPHVNVYLSLHNSCGRSVNKTKVVKNMDLQDYYFKMPLKTEPIIDDTTLRDGIQMPGLAAGPKDAAKIAQFLADIGVERIELFHYQEPDKKAAKLIADLNLDLRVAGWCRAVKEDIDSAVACGFKEVGISHPVSDLHFRAKWPKKPENKS